MRFIGVGSFPDSEPRGIALHGDIIAVGKWEGTTAVALFRYSTGEAVREFGERGNGEGQLGRSCDGLRFTADGTRLLIYARPRPCVRVFTVEGAYVKSIGEGVLGGGQCDVESVGDDVIVADYNKHCIRVFSLSSGETLRSFGSYGTADGQFSLPTALAVCGPRLYVLDFTFRVQVFV